MNSIMTLLKPINNPSLLTPYKQYYIQSLHREGKLIPEQNSGEINPLFKMAINPPAPALHMNRPVLLQPATWILPQPATPKLQHTSKQGTCNLKLTTPEYISKALPINQSHILHT